MPLPVLNTGSTIEMIELDKGWLHYTKFVEPELSEDPEYIFRMLVKPRSSIACERAKLIINN